MGMSYNEVANELNQRGIQTTRKRRWHCSTVWRLAKAGQRQNEPGHDLPGSQCAVLLCSLLSRVDA